MKKIITIITIIALMLNLCSCGLLDIYNSGENPEKEYDYSVKKSPDGEPVGTYDNFNDAKNTADIRKNEDYKVYDKNNTVVYAPKDNVASENLYSVRQSPDNETTQVGLLKDFEAAKALADAYRDYGYSVYNKNGNLLYNPSASIYTGGQSNQVKYTVRLSAYDSNSQIGAFADYSNAVKLADSRKNEGYKVYDLNGNLLYAPYVENSYSGNSSSSVSGSNGVKYKVRKSANDSGSQIGAFADYSNAVKLADSRKNEGYKVYDLNGNLLYAPYVENSYSGNSSSSASGSNGVKYKVRKSANDSGSQIGAFADYSNAVKLADSRKNEGYKVYDLNGNLIYTP